MRRQVRCECVPGLTSRDVSSKSTPQPNMQTGRGRGFRKREMGSPPKLSKSTAWREGKSSLLWLAHLLRCRIRIAELIASLLAAEQCSCFSRSHVEAKGVNQQRLSRSWGLGAHLGWARLLTHQRPHWTLLPRCDHEAGVTISASKRKMSPSGRENSALKYSAAPFLTETQVGGTR